MSEILRPEQSEYINILRNEQNELTLEMEAFAKERKIPILEWTSAEFLEQLILIHKPKHVLEIGTAIGYTTIKIARIMPEEGLIDTIEISRDNIPIVENFIKRSNLGRKVNLIEGDAFKIIPTLRSKYDLIFLDADKEDYIKLFEISLPLLKKGGVMFVDNLLWHGCPASKKVPGKYEVSTEHIREFNKMFLAHPELKTTILSIGDGIGLGIKL
ncbi:O-methyltransferase [Bacteroidota bacterium]